MDLSWYETATHYQIASLNTAITLASSWRDRLRPEDQEGFSRYVTEMREALKKVRQDRKVLLALLEERSHG